MAPTPSGPKVWRWGRWVPQSTSSPPAADIAGLRFFEFNMCGSVCNKGDVGGVVDAIRDSVLSFQPDIVLLNEACLAQVDRLWEVLNGRGYSTTACFGASTGRSDCPGVEGERWFGNAVLSRGVGIGAPEMLALPNRPNLAEQRSIISMAAELRGVPALVSATHLTPRSKDETYNRLQITELARIQNERAEGGNIVVFGGDFNATPDQVREIYAPTGRFAEVDSADNEPTFKTYKIDYIFLGVPRFANLTGDATSSSWSDHRPLRGSATLKAG
ncbi:MAG TPA: endonuclease/exonuclease/phosphatase family protein [Actinomycetota bacterium]|nr:endonuclease/exonuclease/phosphatase family protein [Actinomycetota bacterium]